MAEIELNGIQYRTGQKISAMDQFHVFRKLSPVMSGMGETFNQMPRTHPATEAGVTEADSPPPAGFWQALRPGAQALADMSKEDSEFVLYTCLRNTMRDNGAGGWARVMADNGAMMFEDIDAWTMLQLTWAVIQDNLGSFFGEPLPNGSAGEGYPSLSLSSK
jgi:hypothetical protein